MIAPSVQESMYGTSVKSMMTRGSFRLWAMDSKAYTPSTVNGPERRSMRVPSVVPAIDSILTSAMEHECTRRSSRALPG